MKYFYPLFFILYSLGVFAQDSVALIHYTPIISGIDNPVWNLNNTSKKIHVSLYGDMYSGSNSITTNFLKNLYYSGFINNDLKDAVSNNLKDKNRAGVLFFSGADVMLHSSNILKGNGALTFGVEYNFQETADFTKDLFHLIFYGNYDLQGKTANFDKSGFNQIEYTKYRIGLVQPFHFSKSVLTAAFHFNIIQGISSYNMNFKTGSLYTAPDGLELDATYNFDVNNTPKSTSIFQWQGFGLGADMYAEYALPESGWRFNIIANDIGFINWSHEPKSITGDTSIAFTGFEIDDLLNATSNSIFQQDTLFNMLHVASESQPYTTLLPIKLNGAISKEFSPSFAVSAGMQHIFNTTYSPLIHIKPSFTIRKTHTGIDVMGEYGGYSGFNFGLGLSQQIKHFSIRLNGNNLLGIINPNTLTGAAAYLILNAEF